MPISEMGQTETNFAVCWLGFFRILEFILFAANNYKKELLA